MADRGTPPFEKCDSTLQLAEQVRVGTRDLNQIEVLGTPIAKQGRVKVDVVEMWWYGGVEAIAGEASSAGLRVNHQRAREARG